MQKTASGSGSNLLLPYSERGRRSPITKILLVMKLTALLLTVAFLQVHAAGSAQHVTISGKDIPLKHVFNAIKQQTGFVVFYNKEILGNTKPVTLTAYNMPLQELLQLVFKEQPVSFTIQEKTIILSHQEKTNPAIERLIIDAPSVFGRIIETDDQPILDVSIRIRGTKRGTTSGTAGRFSLEVKDGEVLDISAVGFHPIAIRLNGEQFETVAATRSSSRRQQPDSAGENRSSQLLISNKQNILIKLTRSNSILDEVVIIPYGKTSRRFATGNVTSIKAKEIERQPVMNILQALEGKVAGMSISTVSGNSAAPIKVEIRGRSSINAGALVEPLYIIDGIPQTTLEIGPYTKRGEISTGAIQSGMVNTPGENPLLFLNPRDIESVDVMKDADATAIYGSRGANGVILITTKKAKAGPTRFNMTINNGINSVPKRAKLLSTPEYLAVRREALRNDGVQPGRYNAPDLTYWDTTRYTDWQRELIGTGNVLSVNARVSGGMAQTAYSIAANYQTRKEIMNNGSKNNVGGLRLNLSHTSLNQKFQIDAGAAFSITDINAYRVENPMFLPPNAPPLFDKNGDFNFEPYREQYISGFRFTGLKTPSESKSTFMNTNISLRYELIRGLTLSTTAGYNITQNNNAMFMPAAAYDPAFPRPAQAIFGNSHNNNWTLDPQLQYTTLFGKANLSVQVGATIQQAVAKSNTTTAFGFPNDNLIRSINNALAKESTDSRADYKYSGAYAIINFRWDNRYIINLSGRRDGSSRFGPGKQFGNFGSAGLAWIASDEKWMQNILPNWISFIKFRGSYGITGRDAGQDYGYITRWASAYDIGNFAQKIYDYNGSPGFHIARSINPEYGWEGTKKLEVAASLSLFKDRLNFDVSWYSNRSGNQITGVNTPSYTGFSSVTANWDAVVQNTGLEFSLNSNVLQTKDWNIRLSANISRNRNKLVKYPGFEFSSYANSYVIGKPITISYLLHYTGIDPLTGNYTFEDRNKDGKVQVGSGAIPRDASDDRYIEFDRSPRFEGGFGATASYKNFSLYTNFVFKKRMAQDPFLNLMVGSMSNFILPDEVKNNHWQQAGDKALYPRYTATGNLGNIGASNGSWVDGSYLRMNTLSIAYDLPAKWIQRIRMQGCRLSAETQNLFVITSYKGIDPEVQSLSGFTPLTRVITTTLTINF
jgi:TonB-linked SusC/RagA family outer membrane protein